MSTKKPAPMVKFSNEVFERICERMTEGESLLSICKLKGMPNKRTVLRWLEKSEDLQRQYSRAMELRADHYFDEMIDVARKSRVGSKKKVNADGGVEITSYDMVDRSRLEVDTLKWALARMNPKKYGDKFTQELTGANGGAVQLVLNGSDIHG